MKAQVVKRHRMRRSCQTCLQTIAYYGISAADDYLRSDHPVLAKVKDHSPVKELYLTDNYASNRVGLSQGLSNLALTTKAPHRTFFPST